MKKINVTIVKNGKDGYICTCEYQFEDFDLGGSGDTVAEAKEDCLTFYNEMKEIYPDKDFPKLEIAWRYDLPSFFNHLGVFNLTKVAEYAGINPSNFRHYVAGSKPVSITQLQKIQEAFNKIAEQLRTESKAVIIS